MPDAAAGQFLISSAYSPWPKQTLFHLSQAKFRLQVGGYGSGKSKPLLWEAIFHCLEYPGAEAVILRKTIPDLKRTVISKFISDIPKEVYDYYHETDHIVYFHPVKRRRIVATPEGSAWQVSNTLTACQMLVKGKDCLDRNIPQQGQCAFCRDHEIVQSKLYFGAVEREKDVGKYLSTEFVFIGFEEMGEFSFTIFDALRNRNRCPIPGSRPCIAGATNPMGIGWSWIKKIWVDHLPFQGMDPEKYNPKDYEYFHSTVDDNPIYSRDTEYVKGLEASPLRDKIRWGKLETVTGQYFDNWEPARHIRKREDFLFQPWQTYTIGWDYGFGHYACIVWLTKAILKPRFEGEKPKVVNVFTRELALHENTPKEQSEALVMSIPRLRDKEGDETGYAEQIEAVHFSWERFNRTVSNRTVADDVGDLLSAAGLPRPIRSNTDRIAGWQKIYDLLDVDELFVLDDCPTLAEAIPLLVRDPVKLEDVFKPKGVSLNDDIGDAARYAIAGSLLDPDEKPEEVKTAERIAAIKDPMARHVAAFKEYNQQMAKQRQGPKEVIVPSWRKRLQ